MCFSVFVFSFYQEDVFTALSGIQPVMITFILCILFFYLSYYLFGAPDGMIIEETDKSITIIGDLFVSYTDLISIDGKYCFTFDAYGPEDWHANAKQKLLSYEKDGVAIFNNKDKNTFEVIYEFDASFKYDPSQIKTKVTN
jgi:hypothetical protein